MSSVRSVVGGVVVAVGLVLASPAVAAFPGANGLLAVQPVAGHGIVLVNVNGRIVRRICTDIHKCGTPRRPRWSPDGRSLVFAGPKIRIVYTDGSCMDCQFGGAPAAAFEASGTVVSFIEHGRVNVDGIDGLRKGAPGVAHVTDAVWSASGELAVVRRGALWAGRPGKLRRIAPGAEPSWSPRGDRLAAVQQGWVVIVDGRNHLVDRLARGSAPAFSPDGRLIAFVAPDDRLMIVAAGGGRARPVGRVRAVSVDWQPRPRGQNPGCAAPPRSGVIASTPGAVVTQDGALGRTGAGPLAYMGCLRADGRERLLARFATNNYDEASWVTSAVLAGPYAALIERSADEHYGGQSDVVRVINLRRGRSGDGGESASCPPTTLVPCMTIDDVVVGSDGVSGAHVVGVAPNGSLSKPLTEGACAPATTLCVALGGELFTSQDASAGPGSWSSGTINVARGVSVPQAVACPAQSSCVAAGSDIYTSSDPADGPSTWEPTALNVNYFLADGLTCPTTTLCVVASETGAIATSTNPTGGTAAWTVTQLASRSDALVGAVCSAEPRCFVSDYANTVFTSGNPTGGTSEWTQSSGTPAFESGSCPTSSLCVTVGNGDIATTTAPDLVVWTRQSIPDNLAGVSCPSSSLCVAIGAHGALYVSTDPAAGTWSRTTIDYGFDLTSVSCASTSLCIVTDANGHVLTSSSPAADPSAWVPTLLDGDPCTDGHPCSVESIETSDATGVHTVDSTKLPGSGPFLTAMRLSGDTLSWGHDGSPRSVTMTPP